MHQGTLWSFIKWLAANYMDNNGIYNEKAKTAWVGNHAQLKATLRICSTVRGGGDYYCGGCDTQEMTVGERRFPGTLQGWKLPESEAASSHWLVETRDQKSACRAVNQAPEPWETEKWMLEGCCPLPLKEPTSEDAEQPAQCNQELQRPCSQFLSV